MQAPSIYEPNTRLRPIRLEWNRHCPFCNLVLLTGERPGFCCGPQGSRLREVGRLPALPAEYNHFLNDPRISSLSRKINGLFSFAALQTDHRFPETWDGFAAVQGKVYHQIRPNHYRSGIRWALYDGYARAGLSPSDWLHRIPTLWTDAVSTALLRINPLTRQLRLLSNVLPNIPEAHLRLRDDGPRSSEIAAVMRYDNSAAAELEPRSLTVIPRTPDGRESKLSVPTVSRMWEPLAYPLLFPHGSFGWGIPGAEQVDLGPNAILEGEPETTQIWFYRLRILHEPRFSIFGRLTNEYAIDMLTRNLETRLHYIRQNQERLRTQDALLMDDGEGVSENIYLPASFMGSRRWSSEQVADALAIAAVYGSPTFFITMTCNPHWPEIAECLRPGQTFADIPMVVVRVFAQKLSLLISRFKSLFPSAGERQYTIQVVEFQKRGLPHAHILIKFEQDCVIARDIDAAVSGEMPTDLEDARLVQEFMIHSCGPYCERQRNGGETYCRFGYPQPLLQESYSDDEGRVHYRRRSEQDKMVVPHCIHLLRMFRCHINVEVASPAEIFQYMFKYMHKGPDRAHFTLREEEEPVDEIEDYWNARYLSAAEAVYRICGKHITRKFPAVTALPVHLPDSHTFRQYTRRDDNQSQMSNLDRYFHRPIGTFRDHNGHVQSFASLRYAEYYTLFRTETWTDRHERQENDRIFFERQGPAGQRRKVVIQRTATTPHIARVMMVKPSAGELFFLRALLLHSAASSFAELRTIDGFEYETFQQAVERLGLFADHREADKTMAEAVAALRTPHELRLLFVDLLVTDTCHAPLRIWDTFKGPLIHDHFIENHRNGLLAEQLALQSMADLLILRGRQLEDFGLPAPRQFPQEVLSELRRWNSDAELLAGRAANARRSFTDQQVAIFDEVMDAVNDDRPLLLFIDGKAGTGKTYLLNALCDAIRSKGHIVIPTATSAYAAQLYRGGRTAHSAFKIPVEEESAMLESTIQPGQTRAELLQETKVFIWDESPMANRAAVGSAEDLLQRVMENAEPFGGKIFLLVGDFRQTAPVIRRGSRAHVVDASIRSAPFWNLFTVRRLTIPIRNATDPEYANYVDTIGGGAGPQVPIHPTITTVSLPAEVVHFGFPIEVRRDPEAAVRRAILAPTNRQIDDYNSIILDALEGESRTYYAADSIKEVDATEGLGPEASVAILDFAAERTPQGLPAHSLKVVVGGVYRLMRNMAPERGLVKNMRCVIQGIGRRLIIVRLIRPDNDNRMDAFDTILPRIPIEAKLPSGHTIVRRQFPIAPAYATTFNSCQGLTLDRVSVDLTRPVFSHGQLYTALSRVRDRTCIIARLLPETTTALNVTYSELLL